MATKVSEDINLNLKDILKEKGVMSKDLAEYLDISAVAMSKIINNKTTPSLGTLAKIAKFLNMKLSTLLGEEPLIINNANDDFIALIKQGNDLFSASSIAEARDVLDKLENKKKGK